MAVPVGFILIFVALSVGGLISAFDRYRNDKDPSTPLKVAFVAVLLIALVLAIMFAVR